MGCHSIKQCVGDAFIGIGGIAGIAMIIVMIVMMLQLTAVGVIKLFM